MIQLKLSDTALKDFLRIHHPVLLGKIAPVAGCSEKERLTLVTLYDEYLRQFHTGTVPSVDSLKQIRGRYAREAWALLAPYVDSAQPRKDIERALYSFLGAAIKQLFGAGSDGVRQDSQFDQPQHHALLHATDVRHEIQGYVRAQMIRRGFCPRLAVAFQVEAECGVEALA